MGFRVSGSEVLVSRDEAVWMETLEQNTIYAILKNCLASLINL